MDNLHKGASGNTFRYARENRQNQTEAEKLLWNRIRNRKLNGFKFRRQHPISNFIADFYCHECLLAIEVDGNYHNRKEQKDYDSGRTFEVEELGIKIIRFRNEEIENDINIVLKEIKKHLILGLAP